MIGTCERCGAPVIVHEHDTPDFPIRLCRDCAVHVVAKELLFVVVVLIVVTLVAFVR